jgi:hypothetical protein
MKFRLTELMPDLYTYQVKYEDSQHRLQQYRLSFEKGTVYDTESAEYSQYPNFTEGLLNIRRPEYGVRSTRVDSVKAIYGSSLWVKKCPTCGDKYDVRYPVFEEV